MSEPEASITSSTTDGVLHLVMNRPARKNALTVAMYVELAARVRAVNTDPAVRVVLVSGAGGCFTSGNDLGDFMNTPPAGQDSPVGQFLLALGELEKPLVCAVQGPAVGIGTTMLLHADIVYADESARFRMPFVNLGLCPEGASSLLLPRMMGMARAAELLMFGDVFDSTVAMQVGICSAVLPSAGFADEVAKRARTLAGKPPASLRATKQLLRRPTREAVLQAIAAEGELFMQRLRSEEAAEAFTAFFEKRTPDFTRFS